MEDVEWFTELPDLLLDPWLDIETCTLTQESISDTHRQSQQTTTCQECPVELRNRESDSDDDCGDRILEDIETDRTNTKKKRAPKKKSTQSPSIPCSRSSSPEDRSSESSSLDFPQPYSPEERRRRVIRYLEKKKRRTFIKRVRYICRKTSAAARPRIKGRFVKPSSDLKPSQTIDSSQV
mmetsp:Transcript_45956/g.74964  ORF Transcript_45956/g.74964 Transcript_45956/m.74964 type:complete len:180 (+) Transcript_45956:119-658(+)